MGTRRKILVGVATFALPATSLFVLGGGAIFAGASQPAFPVACKLTATVTFTPPLTKTGTVSTNRTAVTTMAITGGHLSACLSSAPATAPGHGTFLDQTVKLPATKLTGTRNYATGYCPAFTGSGTLKALKGLVFDISWTGGAGGQSVFTNAKATTALNIDGEFGLVLAGKPVSGMYFEKPLNQITEFIDVTDSAALTTGCAASQTVTTATIDVANSVAIL
jgi:hypothetical protein